MPYEPIEAPIKKGHTMNASFKQGALIAGAALAIATLLGACTKKESASGDASVDAAHSGVAHTATEGAPATELKIEDIKVGTGPEAVSGKMVTVHYTGTLMNGKKFDSSLDRNEPFQFALGAGQVIKGWDQGVAGMKVGGKRKLTIPSQLGYGEAGAGDAIPPNSTLLFDVELIKVQ